MRTFLAFALVLFLAACSQNQGLAATASDTDCRGYGLREATMLGVRAMQVAGPGDLALLSRRSDADARLKADEVNAELDAFEQKAEAAMTKTSECFEGDYGNEVTAKYSWVKGIIADQRNAVKEALDNALARNKRIDEERSNFERWRTENREDLIRHVGGMRLEIVRITKSDTFGSPATVIAIQATNTTTSRILKPKNYRVWGYQYGSDVGGQVPVGASLTDSFGNDYKLTWITPSFLGNEAGGIRPGQTVMFEVRFGDVPLQNAKSVRLVVEPATFGQTAGTTFDLSSGAFYGTGVRR